MVQRVGYATNEHYSDVSNHRRLDYLLSRMFRRWSKNTTEQRSSELVESYIYP